MRKASDTDFVVEVEDVGRFTFGKRKMKDEIVIQREYADMIGGVDPTPWLSTVCTWIATFRVLIVAAPKEWDIDELDPQEPESYAIMAKVHNALVERERSFRSQPDKNSQEAGA